MKLLFKENTSELNDLLGFVDADIEIKKIRSDVFTATREVVALIGSPTYDAVVKLYEAETTPEPDTEVLQLIYSVQYPIAVNAYRHYVPSGDLSHTNNGRKMRNDEHEKAAFEWMINKDDAALEKRYYKALDHLLDYLDETNPVIIAALDPGGAIKWKDTDAFKKTHKLFVRSTTDFEEYFAIDSRLLLFKLQPGLNQCERDEIMPRIGKEKFDKLKADMVATAGEPDERLLAMVKEACVYYALAWAIRRLRVLLLPEGILQKYSGERVNSKNTKVPEKTEAELVEVTFRADAEKVLLAIESYIKPAPTVLEIKEGNIYPALDFDCDDQFIST